MLSRIALPIWVSTLLLVGCNAITNSTPTGSELSEPIPIKQINDKIEGLQGEPVLFHLSDYFISESPIQFVVFNSDSVTIEEMENDSFRVTQSEDLVGEYLIEGTLSNESDQVLQTQLTYLIEDVDSTSQEPKPDQEPDPDLDPDPDPDPPTSDGTLVLMPLGDSMTNDSRSRVTLWNLLEADGHELDYVGDQKQTSSIPDADHEGVGGIKIHEIMDKTERLMSTHKPEYVLLMVGTNDIAWYFDETGQEIADRWNNLVQRIFDSSEEGTYVIAATIPPVSSKNVGSEGMPVRDRSILVEHYNSALRSHIEQRKAKGENIILADMEAKLIPDQHLSSDGVHLNEEGYKIMGTVYYEAVTAVLKDQE